MKNNDLTPPLVNTVNGNGEKDATSRRIESLKADKARLMAHHRAVCKAYELRIKSLERAVRAEKRKSKTLKDRLDK